MLKAYKFRIYPTKTQIVLIEKHFGSCRFLYNYFLDYRQKEYAKGVKKINYNITQVKLTKLKKLKEYTWLNECASQSFTVPQNIKVANNRVYFPRFVKDGIKTKVHREIPKEAILKQATILRQNSQYFISILIDDGVDIPKPIRAKNTVGIDMGLNNLLITSKRVKYENKKYIIKSQKRLKKLQRRVSKKQKVKVQKLHIKISNEITNQYDIVCLETLNIKGMIKNKRLAKGIADVAWGKFMRQLKYKSS